GYLLLFGGLGVGGVFLNDTWGFSAGVWSNLTNYSSAPPARWGASMVYDRSGSQVVLFGGCGVSVCPRNDTWRYATGVWKNLTIVAGPPPPAREGGAFAWDSGDTQGLLFGGCGAVCPMGDTWSYSKGRWAPLLPPASPPPRAFASLTYLGQENVTVLVGGNGSLGPIQDTWKYSLARWSNVTAAVGPGPSARFAMASLESTAAWPGTVAKHLPFSVDYGGSNAPCLTCAPGPSNDTWVLELPLAVTPTSLPSLVEVGEPVSFTAVAIGGTGPYVYLWRFGDLTSQFTQSPIHSYTSTAVYTATVTASDLAGVTEASQVTVTVLPGPAVGMGVQPLSTDVGLPVAFTGTVSGGTPPYSVLWSFGDLAASTALGASHPYGAAGNYSVSLRVTDTVQGYGVRWTNVTVHPLPSVEAVLSTTTPTVSENATFVATVNDGTGPFVFTWDFGDGTVSSNASAAHAYRSPGAFHASIEVVDGVGAVSRDSFSLLVQPAPTNSTAPVSDRAFGVPLLAWLAFGAAAVIAGVAAVWILRQRRPPPTSLAAAPVDQPDWRDDEGPGSPTSSRSMRRSVDRFYRRRT
ncbi:MAG TPA: PKD domain-containing protein, partial [Thermoplasmata archaeon]